MTYQADFTANKYAQIAVQVGHKHCVSAERMHSLAQELLAFEQRREADGKQTSLDHLRQQAVKLIRR